jgi:hypothetical protein
MAKVEGLDCGVSKIGLVQANLLCQPIFREEPTLLEPQSNLEAVECQDSIGNKL